MLVRLSHVRVNDRVILPPFGREVGFEYHNHRRSVSRRVLAISREGEIITITLDGCEPRTLPESLQVHVL